MSKAPPERIHPFRLARKGETLHGRVPIGRMHRLAELLHEPVGEAEFELRFGRDEHGQACVLGHIQARLVMICQRCLEPMEVDVACQVSLALIQQDEDIQVLDERYEPLKVGDEAASLPELIEDEMLLALPNFSRHPRGVCAMPEGADAEVAGDGGGRESGESTRENPFSILKSLKSRKSS
jgi:uncharacterized protein